MHQRDPRNYFIKKKFVPNNNKKGLFLQISKEDIKHYLVEHHNNNVKPNHLVEKIDEQEFNDIVSKFFIQSKSTMVSQDAAKNYLPFNIRA